MTTQLMTLANFTSPAQMIFVLVVLLLLFGAKKLPELAKGLGQAIKEFSKAKNDIHDEIMRDPPPQAAKQIEPPVDEHVVQATPASGTEPVNPAHKTETQTPVQGPA
jgi:sec-independent protein translocase protein TatA